MTIEEINGLSEGAFVSNIGPVFERSPWIALEAWRSKPFADPDALRRVLAGVVQSSSSEAQVELIRAHPDLAGRLAQAGELSVASAREQAAAGLTALAPQVHQQLNQKNASYRARFGFPFVICARLNDANSILEAMDLRMAQSLEAEIDVALSEILKIANLRLMELISET